jgi:hypothetical protein
MPELQKIPELDMEHFAHASAITVASEHWLGKGTVFRADNESAPNGEKNSDCQNLLKISRSVLTFVIKSYVVV